MKLRLLFYWRNRKVLLRILRPDVLPRAACRTTNRGSSTMKTITVLAVALGLGSLAACNQSPTEEAADNIEANAEATADVIEENTDAAADAMAANGQAAADEVRAEGDNAADAVEANAN
ncbi:MAG: hypothetical protein ABIS39_02555 [Sphingomicrobium sp.]